MTICCKKVRESDKYLDIKITQHVPEKYGITVVLDFLKL